MIDVMMNIHKTVLLDFKENDPVLCSSYLLSKLHLSFIISTSKLEQDVSLALYLGSLYKYINIIDEWLKEDILHDYRKEFIISE